MSTALFVWRTVAVAAGALVGGVIVRALPARPASHRAGRGGGPDGLALAALGLVVGGLVAVAWRPAPRRAVHRDDPSRRAGCAADRGDRLAFDAAWRDAAPPSAARAPLAAPDGVPPHEPDAPLPDAPAFMRWPALETELRRAGPERQFELLFQPIVALESRQVVAFEALLRWRHPRHGLIGPARFLAIAEDTGLIESIGEWALNAAFEQARRWPVRVAVAVNLSPVQLRSPYLAATVERALRRTGIAAERVEFEVTAAAIATPAAVSTLHRLRGLGARITLDDFDAGADDALPAFPFARIKIDRHRVRRIVGDDASAAAVQALATRGHARGMTVTAEGADCDDLLVRACALGCDEAQGYALSPARDADEALHILRRDLRGRALRARLTGFGAAAAGAAPDRPAPHESRAPAAAAGRRRGLQRGG